MCRGGRHARVRPGQARELPRGPGGAVRGVPRLLRRRGCARRDRSQGSVSRDRNASQVRLRVPQPYDFALSTARFRDFGSDGATVLHEGGLHRVVDGVEVRVTSAPGGVAIEPWSEGAAAEIGRLLGLPFDLGTFRTRAELDPTLAGIVAALSEFRPT